MTLSADQLEAIHKGEPVRLQEAGADIVVLRADIYERMRELLENEDERAFEKARLAASKKSAIAFMKDNPY